MYMDMDTGHHHEYRPRGSWGHSRDKGRSHMPEQAHMRPKDVLPLVGWGRARAHKALNLPQTSPFLQSQQYHFMSSRVTTTKEKKLE